MWLPQCDTLAMWLNSVPTVHSMLHTHACCRHGPAEHHSHMPCSITCTLSFCHDAGRAVLVSPTRLIFFFAVLVFSCVLHRPPGPEHLVIPPNGGKGAVLACRSASGRSAQWWRRRILCFAAALRRSTHVIADYIGESRARASAFLGGSMVQGQCWLRRRGPTHTHLKHVSIITAHRGNPLWAAGGVETSPYFLASAVAKPPYVFGVAQDLSRHPPAAQALKLPPSGGRPLRNPALPCRRVSAKRSPSGVA